MKVKRIVGISQEDFDRLPESEKGKYEIEAELIDGTIEEYVRRNGGVFLEELEERLNNLLDNVKLRNE